MCRCDDDRVTFKRRISRPRSQNLTLWPIPALPAAFVGSGRERFGKGSVGRVQRADRDAGEPRREGSESAFRSDDTICRGGGASADQFAGPAAVFGREPVIEGD